MARHPYPCPNTKIVNAACQKRAEDLLEEANHRASQLLLWASCQHGWETRWDESYEGLRTDAQQEWYCSKCGYDTATARRA